MTNSGPIETNKGHLPRFFLLGEYVLGVVLAWLAMSSDLSSMAQYVVPPFLLHIWNSDLELAAGDPAAISLHSMRIFAWVWVLVTSALNLLLTIYFPHPTPTFLAQICKLEKEQRTRLLVGMAVVVVAIVWIYFVYTDPLGFDGSGLVFGNLRDGTWQVLYPVTLLLVPPLVSIIVTLWSAVRVSALDG